MVSDGRAVTVRRSAYGNPVERPRCGELDEVRISCLVLMNTGPARTEISTGQDVLRPGSHEFRAAIAGRGLVHMATTSAEFSSALGEQVRGAAGWYVEAPVSGSRGPAELAQLVAMAAGDADRLDDLEPVLTAMCHRVLRCGAPPAGTRMKFAVNIYLLALVTALAEAYHFAQASHLDLGTFVEAVNSGQMACPIAAVKLDKLQRGDLSPQAAIPDVYKNSQLIAQAARQAQLATPLARCLPRPSTGKRSTTGSQTWTWSASCA